MFNETHFTFTAAPVPNVDVKQYMEIFQNDPLFLNCSMNANPISTYEWFKDE